MMWAISVLIEMKLDNNNYDNIKLLHQIYVEYYKYGNIIT